MDYKGDIFYIKQVLEGKTIAYTYLVDQHKDHAFNLAFRICGNREEAEEIAQDAFIKAYKSLGNFKMRSSFATWLYRIVYNSAISLIRTRKKVISLEDFPGNISDSISYSDSEAESKVEEDYRNTLLNIALQKISEEEKGLISLYYFEEMTIDEISEVTGLNKSTIKVKLFRARQKMLEIIQESENRNKIHYEKAR
jgi:RNA polymerase sigma factor (sigma-70 family)